MIPFDFQAVLTDERIWDRVTEDENGCWLWPGAKVNGYAKVIRLGWPSTLLHRVVYMAMVGEIPDGLELDHLCNQPACINPYHMDPVPHSVNAQRRSAAIVECPSGHAYTPENTLRQRGYRYCRTCHRDRQAARRAVA